MRRRRESAYGDADRARDPDAEQDRDDACPPKQMEDSGEEIRSVGRIISPMAGLVPKAGKGMVRKRPFRIVKPDTRWVRGRSETISVTDTR